MINCQKLCLSGSNMTHDTTATLWATQTCKCTKCVTKQKSFVYVWRDLKQSGRHHISGISATFLVLDASFPVSYYCMIFIQIRQIWCLKHLHEQWSKKLSTESSENICPTNIKQTNLKCNLYFLRIKLKTFWYISFNSMFPVLNTGNMASEFIYIFFKCSIFILNEHLAIQEKLGLYPWTGSL